MRHPFPIFWSIFVHTTAPYTGAKRMEHFLLSVFHLPFGNHPLHTQCTFLIAVEGKHSILSYSVCLPRLKNIAGQSGSEGFVCERPPAWEEHHAALGEKWDESGSRRAKCINSESPGSSSGVWIWW